MALTKEQIAKHRVILCFRRYALTTIVLNVAIASRLFSQPVLTLHDGQEIYSLAGHLDYYFDDDTSRTIEEISSDFYQAKFRFVGNGSPSFGHVYDILWLRFRLRDTSAVSKEWLVENEYAIVENMNLFYLDEDGHWMVGKSGSAIPFQNRSYPDRKLILPIAPTGKDTKELFIRVSTRTSMSFSLRIFSNSALAKLDQEEYFYYGMFNGILILMFVYNLFLYLSIRETSYLAYTFYVICLGTYESFIDGTAVQFIGNSLPAAKIALVFAWLTVSSSSYFATVYLQLKKSSPRFYTFMTIFMMAGFAMASYSIVGDFLISNKIVNYLAIGLPALQLLLGIFRFRQGFKPSKYYILAVSGYVIGFFFRSLKNLGFIAPTDITLVSLQIGVIWEFVILSFGLANRVNTVKEEEQIERERMRNQIAADIHDEIGSNLSSITISSGLVQKANNLNEKQKEFLMDISETAQETADSMRDIVWFINPQHDNPHETVAKMEEVAQALLQNFRYTFTVNETVFALIANLETRKNLYFIYKEALNNIIKHSHATEVRIHMEKKSNGIEFTVSDNGVGFDPTAVHNGNGLRNLSKRSAEMNATLQLRSNSKAGTVVSLFIKIP